MELGATEGKEMGDGELGQLVRTEGLTVVQSVCMCVCKMSSSL